MHSTIDGSPRHALEEPSAGAVQPSPERIQIDAMASEGGGVPSPTADPPTGVPLTAAPSEEMSIADARGAWLTRPLRHAARTLGHRYLLTLAHTHGRVSESLGEIATQAHRRAEQTRLALELIDDFKDGTYRAAPWVSVAALAAALLYCVSPYDVIPDLIPGLGKLDDLTVLALAIRFARADLLAYCRFKGYRESDYFQDRQAT